MAADADDLLERARRAEERDVPTLDQLKDDLERALDELDRRLPEGQPPRGHSDGSGGLRYQTLMLRIENLSWALENGDYRELPRDEPHVVEGASDGWEAFVESHPELTVPPTFTDDEVLDALRTAIENTEEPWAQGATCSARVVEVLLPGGYTKALSVRTGKQLARLAREGRVVRFRRKWTKGRGDSIWSLPGIEINPWWFKQYEADDAR